MDKDRVDRIWMDLDCLVVMANFMRGMVFKTNGWDVVGQRIG